MGLQSEVLAEGYSAEAWAYRWHNYIADVLEGPSGH